MILTILILNYLIFVIAVYTNTDPFDYYNPKRWRSFTIYLAKLYLHKNNETDKYLTQSELIQYGYRFAKCYDCIISGTCKNCGCDAVGRVNGKTDFCSLDKWGEFLPDEEVLSIFKDPDFKFEIIVNE